MQRPTQEQFDHMNDTAFVDWWDNEVQRVQANATDESEVDEVCAARAEAHEARWPS